MLIYNHNKEFLGIGENDLKTFGFSDLEEFKSLTEDFADLFIKATGYIYNFNHIHWIDYIACCNDNSQQKAIIRVKEKEYTVSITIDTIYLVQEPLLKAYCINLNIIKDPLAKNQTPVSQPLQQPVMQKTEEKKSVTAPYEETDLAFDIPQKSTSDILGDEKEIRTDTFDDSKSQKEGDRFNNYVYNLQKASDMLGLPVDLVAEFIEDYTTQANSFKEKLYISLKNGDLTTLKTEAHKLIGVAENLKIENALDVLGKISRSQNIEDLKLHLDKYFQIIDDLSSKKEVMVLHTLHEASSETHPDPQEEKKEEKKEENHELLTLTFKEDTAPASQKASTTIDTDDLLPLEFK